jgi:hypothetical protein
VLTYTVAAVETEHREGLGIIIGDENIYAGTLLDVRTFLIALIILFPFSVICSSVHDKVIALEMHRLMIASLAVKSLLA